MFGIPTIPVVTKTLTAATPSVTLYYASPGGTPRHLLIRTNVLATSGTPNLRIRLNGDSGSNYNIQLLDAAGSSASGLRESTDHFGLPTNVTSDSNEFSGGEFLFPDALSTRTDKAVLSMSGRVEDFHRMGVGRWENTAAITSVELYLDSSTFTAGSTFEMAVVDEAYAVKETINTGTAQFDESSISAADGDLVVIGNLRSDVSSHIEEIGLRFNSDTTDGNYRRQRMTAHNGTITGAYSSASNAVAHAAGANSDADGYSGFLAQIPNFSDGSNDRTALTFGGGHFSDSDQQLAMMGLRWNNTAAITSVQVTARNGTGWLADSMLSIYAVPKGQITRTELDDSASSVAFTNIPQTYDHLEITAYVRDDRSATSDDIWMSLTPVGGSSDTTDANYDTQLIQGSGSTLTAASSAADRTIGNIVGNTETANVYGALTITLYNYTKTDRHKHSLSMSGRGESATGVYFRSNRWENTAAIEAITLTPSAGSNFLAGSVFTLRGITATPTTSDAANINSVVIGSIAAINSVAIASIQAMNGVALTGVGGGGSAYAGITWAADDTLLNAYGMFSVMGKKGALGIIGHDQSASPTENYMRTAEHDGSSWSTSGNTNARHGVSQTGGTQTAGVIYGGYTGSDESNVTEEYNGSTWATGNNMVQGTNGGIGGGWLQTAQLCSGGSSYNPTVRDISTTQTYDGTNWSNESVSSQGRNTGTSGENGSGLDSFLAASGSYDAGTTTDSQLFNQTAGTWTSKASASVKARYLGCGSDGTRVYKIGGVDPSASGGWILSNMKDVVESWVENSWTTENSLPASRQYGGGSGTQAGTGENCAPGGVQYDSGGTSSNKDSFYVSSAL